MDEPTHKHRRDSDVPSEIVPFVWPQSAVDSIRLVGVAP